MGYGYLSCRALHSKIINKRRLMLKTNDVRISDCSLLLHASLKCVCSGNGPLLFRRPPFGPAAAFLLHFLFILLCSRCRRARAVYLHRVKVMVVVEGVQKSQIERRARTPFEAFERVAELSPKQPDSFSPIPPVDSALKPTREKIKCNRCGFNWL